MRIGRRKGKRGEIIVLLSAVLLYVTGLIYVILESAWTAGARYCLQIATNSPMDLPFGQYHRQLWQKYHPVGPEYETTDDVRDRYLGFLTTSLETENWYPITADSTEPEVIQGLTDGDGIWLGEEILTYMKYEIRSGLDIKPEDGEQFFQNVKEAAPIQGLTPSYQQESEEVWKLEQALDNPYAYQARQQGHHVQGARTLQGGDSYRSFRAAGDLRDKIKKTPRLLEAYEEQADKCKARLEGVEAELTSKGEDLTEGRGQMMNQELKQYRSYVAEDNARRREILALGEEGERNLAVIEEVKDRINDIETYLASLDEENDDNSGPVWSTASGIRNQIHTNGQKQSDVKDEKKYD